MPQRESPTMNIPDLIVVGYAINQMIRPSVAHRISPIFLVLVSLNRVVVEKSEKCKSLKFNK